MKGPKRGLLIGMGGAIVLMLVVGFAFPDDITHWPTYSSVAVTVTAYTVWEYSHLD